MNVSLWSLNLAILYVQECQLITELQDLLDDIARIRDDEIKEPDLAVGPNHNVVGKIDDLDMRRLFAGYVQWVHKLNRLHQAVRGPMLATSNIPVAIRAKMVELQDQIDLLRNIFFYALSMQFQLFERDLINVHKGWLVSWSAETQPLPASPKLVGLSDDDDNDDG